MRTRSERKGLKGGTGEIGGVRKGRRVRGLEKKYTKSGRRGLLGEAGEVLMEGKMQRDGERKGRMRLMVRRGCG